MSQSSSSSNNMVGGPTDFGVYIDIELRCKETGCDCKWTFTSGEQEWYDNKGFEYPKRCAACKAIRKGGNGNNGNPNRVTYSVITITCKDCNHPFDWEAKDQAYFAKQNPPFPRPQRCKSCKQDRNQKFAELKQNRRK